MLPASQLLRLARRLHAVWASRFEPTSEPAREWKSLETSLTEVQRLRCRVALASSRNLAHACSQLTEELTDALSDLGRQTGRLRSEYASPEVRPPELCDF